MNRIRVAPPRGVDDPHASVKGAMGCWVLGVVGIVGFVGLVVLVVSLFYGRGGEQLDQVAAQPMATVPAIGTETPVAHLITPTQVLATATPACRQVADELATIERYRQLGNWDEAATVAEGVLGIPNLCGEDVAALNNHAITARLEGLFARKFDPLDTEAQQEAAELYWSLHRRAKQHHEVVVPGVLETAQRGYEKGMFLFTKEVLDEAYRLGDFAPTNQTLVQLYCSATFNQGKWLATQGHDTAQQQEGLRLLVTSYRIDQDPRYRVGFGEAWGELQRLLGPDEQGWPDPVDSPLL